jgi:hypothetical protein
LLFESLPPPGGYIDTEIKIDELKSPLRYSSLSRFQAQDRLFVQPPGDQLNLLQPLAGRHFSETPERRNQICGNART